MCSPPRQRGERVYRLADKRAGAALAQVAQLFEQRQDADPERAELKAPSLEAYLKQERHRLH